MNGIIETMNNKSANEALIDYVNYLNQSNYNSVLSLPFAYLLQFSNDLSSFKQYELKDIEFLYDSFLELNEKCLDIYIDAANFADAIMDNKAKAKRITEIEISKLRVQIAELEELEWGWTLEQSAAVLYSAFVPA